MNGRMKYIRPGLLILAAISLAIGLGFGIHNNSNAATGTYKILGWNDLGMHCYNRDFADLAVLPPFNNLWVQVVRAGDPPKVVTSGITVTYSYPNNTYSVGKTNFWTYAKALFGVNLAPNVGLKGKGLSGTMDLSGDHYVAEGIPITEYSDSAPTVRQPYQLAKVVVKDAVTGVVLATQSVVTPTSSEMRCDRCHSDTGIAKPNVPTGKVETNILRLHDEKQGTTLMASRPVLCATCHASNALGAPGKIGVMNLSKAMHTQHNGIVPNSLDGCYNCHPGPLTRCLRDVMNTDKGMTCINCHGGMDKVASNPNPWLNEPRCDTCHNSGLTNQNNPLYKLSREHGGLYCEACHDSTHAIAPSRVANDAIKFIALQGSNGPLSECSVCHTVPVDERLGPHHPGTTPTHVIKGNTGAASVTLKYMDGTLKSVLSDASGNYIITIPHNWSGKVTPSKAGVPSFTPAFRNYTNVTADIENQDYKANRQGTFTSVATLDGFVLESSETSGVGGSMNSSGVLAAGDNALKRQYRSVLSFNTSTLPDSAVIVSAKIKLTRQTIAGTNPFSTHGSLFMDIRKTFFGAGPALGLDDFAAPASMNAAGSVGKTPVGAVYTGSFKATALPFVNPLGLTQVRLRFQLDDNNNNIADYVTFFAGDALNAAYRPVLVITYYNP